MSSSEAVPERVRIRREPPHFRRVEVGRVEPVTPRLLRITLTGAELDGFALAEPAASVRLLLPPSGTDELVMPTWTGNEFLLPDGRTTDHPDLHATAVRHGRAGARHRGGSAR